MILSQARRMTSSDAGSLYLAERHEAGAPATTLRFKLAQNHTLPNLPLTEGTVPIDHTSLAGYAAATGEPLVIADVYLLPDDVSYRQNRSFDDKFGYRTKSMLVIPMKTHRDEVIGVLQLINRKRIQRRAAVVAGGRRSRGGAVRPARRGAGERARVAGGGRDREQPALRGHRAAVRGVRHRRRHGDRVARPGDVGSFGPRRDVDRRARRGGRSRRRRVRTATSRFSREQLRELRYAGLLHDFGKVGVREQVLVKQKKLYEPDLELIRHRFAYLDAGGGSELRARARRAAAARTAAARTTRRIERLRAAQRASRDELQRYLDAIVQANEPTVLPEGSFDELQRINRRTYVDFEGIERPLLAEHELQYLMIRKGNLDERRAARDRIARHAHLPVPRADPLDARAQGHSGNRLRPPRKAERPAAIRAP